MIPLNEFRIGIIVHATYAGNIYNELAEKVITKEDFTIENLEHWFFPIPLSPEWLIRFGAIFPYDDKLRLELAGLSFYYSPTGLLYLNDSGYNEAISKAVEFVHQLQNLIFSLTGEELTLKN